MTSTRAERRLEWARQHCPFPFEHLQSASSDASFRSYWRLNGEHASLLLMDAPPAQEPLDSWLDIAERLRAAGLRAPQVYAESRDDGFLLIEDLGTELYLPALSVERVDVLYGDAIRALLTMQLQTSVQGLPDYDETRLKTELDLLPQWFLARHLSVTLDAAAGQVLTAAFRRLIDNALAQPQVFVHRDYHSRNLLLVDRNGPGIIDFQDAVRGPLCYDLVSLLRDCYVRWPSEQVYGWLESYRLQLLEAGGPHCSAEELRRDFDLIGLQRHLKVLGIFARLCYRDGKSGYLADLPRVFRYVLDVCEQYPEFHALASLLRDSVGSRDLTRSVS